MRYDPLLTRALAAELRERRAGERTRELLLDRDRRAARLRFRRGPPLDALLHPRAGYLLEGERSPDLGPRPSAPAHSLGRHRLVDAHAPPDERLLVLRLAADGGDPEVAIVIELLDNQWNLLLLEEGKEGDEGSRDRILAALWPREPGERILRAGAPYRPPAGSRAWTDRLPGPDEWSELFDPVPPPERRLHALRRVAWFSAINADFILGDATARVGAEPLTAARERYLSLRREPPRPRLLPSRRPEDGAPQPYTHDLGREVAGTASSLMEAMSTAARAAGVLGTADEVSPAADRARKAPDRGEDDGGRAGSTAEAATAERPDPERERLREALEERADRLERRIGALRRELERGEDPERLREIGNLLLARLPDVPRGKTSVTLEDFAGETRTLELDPKLTPAGNAERYYEEAARRERAAERVPREIEKARRRREEVRRALRALPDAEITEELWRLAGGRPGAEEGGAGKETKLPYRRFFSSGGHEIRVGRGAKQNEELTFHHSSPDDIWLHARQVPGAHVVLRWGHREGNPPRRDLLEAAVLAALHSEARHSGTVGVDWTRRKYVRSPRKSPPGVVVPDRTKTVFVEPDEAVARRLRRP